MMVGGNRYPWYNGLASFMPVVCPIEREVDSTLGDPHSRPEGELNQVAFLASRGINDGFSLLAAKRIDLVFSYDSFAADLFASEGIVVDTI
jgi:hypothetical protein